MSEVVEQPDFLPHAIAAFPRDASVLFLQVRRNEKAGFDIGFLENALLLIQFVDRVAVVDGERPIRQSLAVSLLEAGDRTAPRHPEHAPVAWIKAAVGHVKVVRHEALAAFGL